jgi:hypothetical protein
MEQCSENQQHEIRHACSEIYLTVKHAKVESRLDDQEYQLIIAKLHKIESALSSVIENES